MRLIRNTRDVLGSIEDIVQFNKNTLYIVSPFVQLNKDGKIWQHMIEALESQKKNKRKIIFILQKPSKNPNQTEKLIVILKNYAHQIWLVPHLHSKCYYNGETALVTSMNFYYYSSHITTSRLELNSVQKIKRS